MDNWDIIHAKLNGTLSEEAEALFEKRLIESDSFREHYEISVATLLVKDVVEEEELYKHLKAIKKKNPSGVHGIPWIRIATGLAAAILLLMLSLTFWPGRPDSQELFATEYKQPLDPTVRDSNKTYDDATILFFKEGAESFENWFSFQKNPSLKAKIYHGHSLITLKKWQEARATWVSIQGEYPSADWFEAMAFLGEGRLKEANKILEEIAKKSDHPYHGRAVLLLEKTK